MEHVEKIGAKKSSMKQKVIGVGEAQTLGLQKTQSLKQDNTHIVTVSVVKEIFGGYGLPEFLQPVELRI